MVNVEALERVDALYGPFSAIDPGNSMGVTIVMTERKPKGFEASASLKYNHHRYQQYAVDDHYGSKQLSARLASRLDSGLWYAVSLQRQDSKSHPQNFVNAVRGVTNGAFASPGAGTRVDGIRYDLDPALRPRALFGASGFDHTVQDTLNLRLGYDISATQEIEGRVSFWRHDSNVSAATWLRDAAGRPVWSWRVHDGAYSFTLNGNTLAPSQREDLHRQMGLTWKTRRPTGWNGSVVLTHYAMLKDLNRQASLPQPQALPGGAGSVTRRGGNGLAHAGSAGRLHPHGGHVQHRNEHRQPPRRIRRRLAPEPAGPESRLALRPALGMVAGRAEREQQQSLAGTPFRAALHPDRAALCHAVKRRRRTAAMCKFA